LPQNNQAWQVLSVDGQEVLDWREVYQQVLQALVKGKADIVVDLQSMQGSESKTVVLSMDELDINQPKQNWLSALGFEPKYPEIRPVISRVVEASPAEKMGLQSGDWVRRIDDQPIETWSQLVEYVRKHPGKEVELRIDRKGRTELVRGVLAQNETANGIVGTLGAAVKMDADALNAYRVTVSYGPLTSLEKGWHHTVDLVEMTLDMIKGLLVGSVSVTNISGPVSIAEFSGKAMQSGWVAFLSLLGLLSLSLGILNLLPIPVLDGGHLFFYVIEMIKGAPVNESIEAGAQKIGLMLILGLTFFALFNDVVRISNG
jgi:regulator of sigma E protease